MTTKRAAMVALSLTALLLVATGGGQTPRARAGSGSSGFELRDVQRLLSQWRTAEATKVYGAVARDKPRDPAVAFVGGRVDFYNGHYERAVAKMSRAMRYIASPPSTLRRMVSLARSTAATVKGYKRVLGRGGHFAFYVRPGKDEILLRFASETLEAVRARLQSDLGYAPPDVIRVEIYGKTTDLASVSSLTEKDIERTGTIALCKYNRLMIVSPRALLRGYTWRDTLAHEYVHLVVSRLSHNQVPIWLQEGLAKFFEARWRLGPEAPPPLSPVQRHLLAEAIAPRGKLIKWRAMHPSMAKLPSQRHTALAFAQAQTAVQMLAARKPGALREMIAAMRAGADAWQAVKRATGLGRRAFAGVYRKYLRGLGLKRMPGMHPPKRRFGKRLSKEKRLLRIRETKARKYFRLADMLRQRQLTRAAIIEYRKARTLVGKRDSLVANALARAYLEIGEHDKASNVLLPVLEYYPEMAGPQVTLATAYLRAGNKPAAARHFKIALRVNPFNPAVHCGLSSALPDGDEAKAHRAICQQLR
ncbi:MAG: hypothetical protein KC503_19155 [Myxococcales bacterium]|nr:hypothetical protein [Myxococcales bacterium]